MYEGPRSKLYQMNVVVQLWRQQVCAPPSMRKTSHLDVWQGPEREEDDRAKQHQQQQTKGQ